MLISTALLLDSIIRNSVCTPAKLPCRRVEVGYDKGKSFLLVYNLMNDIIVLRKVQKERNIINLGINVYI
jgi:hypothetical protein